MAVIIPILAWIANLIPLGQAIFMAAVALYGDYQRKKAEKGGRGLAGVSSVERTQMIRESASPRVTLYGQAKISGCI